MLLKLLGVFLLTGGSAGLAWRLCGEQRERLFMLKETRHLYQLLQSEIRYAGLPVPEMLLAVSEKVAWPLSDILKKIGQSGDWEKGKSFGQIWREHMESGLAGCAIAREAKALLLSFPDSMGLMEREGQAKALERPIEELERRIQLTEQEDKNRRTVIASLGIAAGVFLSIILL